MRKAPRRGLTLPVVADGFILKQIHCIFKMAVKETRKAIQMCGIVGFTGRENRKLIKEMARMVIHRGPDDAGYYFDNLVNMGMRRLSIVDLESGQQPIGNEEGDIWTVFNGEIYNHMDLRSSLEKKKHRFVSHHSDTEVIVHLYEEYGERWPLFVNGMFGVAIWDKRRKKLLLFRDRIGKKPLYYSVIGKRIIFGSEIKSILCHPEVSAELDYGALYNYFSMKNVSAPNTAYADIKQLLPGHFLVWKSGRIEISSYWQVDMGDPLFDITEKEASSYLLELFEDAVKQRMQCDVSYGAYLSGGVDSSAVVAMMNRNQSKPIKTFCLGYSDEPDGQFKGKSQDIHYARKISKWLGTEHHEYIIDAEKFAFEMPSVLRAFDEPFSGTVSTFFLSILIGRHVKVALSGDGADELFASYLAHRLAFPIDNYIALKSRGVESFNELSKAEMRLLRPFDNPVQFHFLKKICSHDIVTWRSRLAVFSDDEKVSLLSREFLDAAGCREKNNIYKSLCSSLTATDMLNKSLEIDQKELLPNQVLPFVDRLSMAHSIEVRVPYLDYRIIEFANRLPGSFKIKSGVVKYIHKQAMKELLPDDLINRPKEGFVQPIYSWMHGKLRRWVTGHLDALPTTLFKRSYVDCLKSGFMKEDHSLDAKIWNLVCFGIWIGGKENRRIMP